MILARRDGVPDECHRQSYRDTKTKSYSGIMPIVPSHVSTNSGHPVI
jgi:hypothetical protein